MGHEIIVLV